MQHLYQLIATEFKTTCIAVENIVTLLNDGNTVPFISRYRKELTGSLDADVIYDISDRYNYLEKLQNRKLFISETLTTLGVFTEELKEKIRSITILSELEDLYKPFIPRKNTKGALAIEAGMKPLADAILQNSSTANAVLNDLVVTLQKEKDEILEGAKEIICETLALDPDLKKVAKNQANKLCFITAAKKYKTKPISELYEKFADTKENIKTIPSHRVLAMFRGAKEKELTLDILLEDTVILAQMKQAKFSTFAFQNLNIIVPLLERAYFEGIRKDLASELKEDVFQRGQDKAIAVFSENCFRLLMQKPLKSHVILGYDPGYAHGCKLAVIDQNGQPLDMDIIYPTPPRNAKEKATDILKRLWHKTHFTIVAIGNGTACKESEVFISEFVTMMKEEQNADIKYTIVSEAGASVYSASKAATKEFKDLDIYFRSAISIARRLLDPLSELVKIDPKSLGIGQYQHDLSQTKLKVELDRVVERCVNDVGVNLNTASEDLLKYVSGLNGKSASAIIAYRAENTMFKNRKELKKVAGIGEKTFTQCAGFLRIFGGDNPLDQYFVHPEDYAVAAKLLKEVQG